MLYKSITIANFFLQQSFNEGIEVTPMKLLKLVYIANGWYLGYESEPLIDEGSQAWKYGPVIVSVYNAFKSYGSDMIEQMHMPTDEIREEFQSLMSDSYATSFLRMVWNAYKDYDGLELSALTHQEGTPWSQTYNRSNTSLIPNNIIREYYEKKIEELNNGGE